MSEPIVLFTWRDGDNGWCDVLRKEGDGPYVLVATALGSENADVIVLALELEEDRVTS